MRLLIPLLLLAALGGCDESNDTGDRQLPVLEVLETFPLDAVFNVETPPGVQGIRVVFNRPPVLSPRFDMAPEPPVRGRLESSPTGRQWSWFDVEMVSDDGAYHWLIDAPELPEPKVIRIRMREGGRTALVGFSGSVGSSDTTRVKPQGAVVFAVLSSSAFNPLEPATFSAVEKQLMAVATGRDRDQRAVYRADYMDPTISVVAIAVVDTDDDQVYDLTRDWWGYYPTTPPGSPRPILPRPTGNEERNDAVQITVRPPN